MFPGQSVLIGPAGHAERCIYTSFPIAQSADATSASRQYVAGSELAHATSRAPAARAAGQASELAEASAQNLG
jgi:hypothetical protein